MSGLQLRLATIAAAVLVSVWMLVPTVMGEAVQARIEAAAERAANPDLPAPATPDAWYIAWLPNKAVNLGLDLKGGIDLTLDVDVEEAVRSSIQRDVTPIKQLATQRDVTLEDVRRDRVQPALLVAAGASDDAVKALFADSFPRYAFSGRDTIDGRGWLRFTMTETERAAIARSSVDQALETIRNRIDETGTKEPVITRKGERGISVQLPGETDMDKAVAAVGTTAQLSFVLVDEEADTNRLAQGLEAAKAALPPAEYDDDERVSEWLRDQGWILGDREVLWETERVEGVSTRVRPYVLKGGAVLTGDDVNDARAMPNPQTGEFYVSLEFKPRGQAIFAQVTGDNVGRRFAIVLDKEVRSAPTIQERINGTASISMGAGGIENQSRDASTLALVLRTGALPAPVTVGEVRTIGASLGDQLIREGVWGAVLGCCLVFLLASIYYRWSGVLAVVSLIVNALLVVALLAALGATLTLPGICGIALTIGMAVDCNVIIFERVREELRAGKGVRAALDVGFDRAFVAVLDSNIATLLAGVVLYSYGTGPLKGFGVTLMLGVFTTLFTGVFVSRAFMDLVFGRGRATTISI